MATDSRSHSCYHKVASSLTNQSLEDLYTAALKIAPRPVDRLQEAAEQSVRFAVTAPRVESTLHCGTLVRYTEGQHLLALGMDPSASDFSIEQVTAGTDTKIKKEFVDGMCFFAIQGNHVLVIQSKAAGISHLRSHLEWLIKKFGGHKDFVLELSNYETPATQARPVSDIKRLSIVSSIEASPVEGAPQTKKELANSAFVTSGQSWDGIRSIFEAFGAKVPKDVEFTGQLTDKDIELRVELLWKRRKTNDREKILETLARALDDSSTTDYEMVFEDDTRRRGRELKLQTALTIIWVNGIPQPASAYATMFDWLQGMIKKGTVLARV